jgi:hypothetical protein
MAHLLAEMESNQAKADTNLKEMRASQELLKEEMLAKMESNQERMDAKLHAHHERRMARMDSQLEKMEAVVDVFKGGLNKMDTMDLEAN